MTLFKEGDKKVYKRRSNERNPLVYGTIKSREIEIAYEYSIEVSHAARRLDIMGFTLDKAREQFDKGMQKVIADMKDGSKPLWWMDESKQVTFFSKYTFEKWSRSFRKLIREKITPWNVKGKRAKGTSPLLRLFLEDNIEEFYYGFPIGDIRYFIRAVLALTKSGDNLVLDITELVHAGYYDGTEHLTKSASASFSKAYLASSTIIVLTEGSSDAHALRRTLALLYPYLTEYYSFLDFGTSNMPGGAANLVGIIKAFIGSGIANRVIAIFDNDTAAQAAMKGLQGITLPKNIAVMRYPPIPYAKNYPTIGPQGIKKMDVNGLAGSLELYFGQDVLKVKAGELTPVQWKGYDSSLRQYQGEVIGKSALQSSYFEKLKGCATAGDDIAKHDWSAMRIIFEAIFNAFN